MAQIIQKQLVKIDRLGFRASSCLDETVECAAVMS
jgi:hypothetical protein